MPSKRGPGRPPKRKKENEDYQRVAFHANDFVKYILSLKTSVSSPADLSSPHMRSIPVREFEKKFKEDQMMIRLLEKEEANRVKLSQQRLPAEKRLAKSPHY